MIHARPDYQPSDEPPPVPDDWIAPPVPDLPELSEDSVVLTSEETVQ